jgi:hypothetical protein
MYNYIDSLLNEYLQNTGILFNFLSIISQQNTLASLEKQ